LIRIKLLKKRSQGKRRGYSVADIIVSELSGLSGRRRRRGVPL
jgi:hypothetical protein